MGQIIKSIWVMVCIVGCGCAVNAQWIGYPNWNRAVMSATESSNFTNAYPAANLVDDWNDSTPRNGFCPDGGGFGIRDDYHASWHSGPEFIGTTTVSPSGKTVREWLKFDFGKFFELSSVDFWNHNRLGVTGRGLKDISIDVSINGADWITVWTGQIPQAPGTLTQTLPGSCLNMYNQPKGVGKQITANLNTPEIARYVVINAYTNWGEDGYFALDEVRFNGNNINTGIDIAPNPANNSACLDPDTILSWTEDPSAQSYDVYLGTNASDVTNATLPEGDIDDDAMVDMNDLVILAQQWLTDPGLSSPSADIYADNLVNLNDYAVVARDWKLSRTIFKGNFTSNSFDPGNLEQCTAYYWRVDKIIDGRRIKNVTWTFATCCGDAQREYYVALDGDDANPGAIDSPFRTLEKARDALENKCMPDGGATIFIRGGKYFRNAAFTLGSQNSGGFGKPIVYRAYPGEDVRIIGGVQLPSSSFNLVTSSSPVWNRVNTLARGNVYVFDLAANGITNYGTFNDNFNRPDISFNGQRMNIARWPNSGYEQTAAAIDSTTFQYSGSRPSSWTNAADAWAGGYWYYGWHYDYSAIANINTSLQRITLQTAPYYGMAAGKFWCAFNLLEDLDVPGEWYIDRTAGKLYFWPPSDIGGSEVIMSMLGTTQGAIIQSSQTSNVQFRDLMFEMGRFRAMWLNGGENLLIDNCEVKNIGEYAIAIGGDHNHTVQNSHVHHVGGAGIYMSGGNRPALQSSGHLVRNNHIHDFALWHKIHVPGVWAEGVGVIVEHNVIYNASHFAIYFTGNDHIFRFNEIYNVCYEVDDAGAIYGGRDWGYRGNRIHNNLIRDLTTTQPLYVGIMGLYLDDCYSSADVVGNIFYNIAGRAILLGGGRDNVFDNNVFVKCSKVLFADARGLQWNVIGNPAYGASWDLLGKIQAMNYTQPPWSTAYPALASILNEGWDAAKAPKGNKLRKNIAWQNNMWTEDGGGISYMTIENNITNQNPLFVDEASLNLALRDDSPAYTILGFERIPFELIGNLDQTLATRPNPSNGRAGLPATAKLYWAPAANGVSRDVYFGMSHTSVFNATTASPEFKTHTADTSFTPGMLNPGQPYFWRVDEYDLQGNCLGKGGVWSFTVSSM